MKVKRWISTSLIPPESKIVDSNLYGKPSNKPKMFDDSSLDFEMFDSALETESVKVPSGSIMGSARKM